MQKFVIQLNINAYSVAISLIQATYGKLQNLSHLSNFQAKIFSHLYIYTFAVRSKIRVLKTFFV